MTVASALQTLNRMHPEDEIRFEHSCLQKKCGACAMVINNVPALACDKVLKKTAKRGFVQIEPLRKFPVVADLIVDRSVLFENLRTMRQWAEEDLALTQEATETAYEASRCLQCGCCLEVCPNFYTGGTFFGMAAMSPASRLIASLSKEEAQALQSEYRRHVYDGCGKSLACQDICPARLPIEHLMSRSNAAAVWKRRGRSKKNG